MDDSVLTFGVSGKLWRNSLIMFDRETSSLWSHITGDALEGRLTGKQMERVASLPTLKWKVAREQFPEGRVLSVNGREGVEVDGYEDYHRSDRIGVRPARLKSNRFLAKEQVIGIRIGDTAKAYPFSAFERRSVIVDEVGGKRIIVFRDSESEASGVFEAEGVDPGGGKGFLMQDKKGEVWNLLTGMAVEGSGKGLQLRRLPHFQGYWFAWVDFNPKTEVYK